MLSRFGHTDQLNRYGEVKGMQTFGVASDRYTVVTRCHDWTITATPIGAVAAPLSTGRPDVVAEGGRRAPERSEGAACRLPPQPAGIPVSRDRDRAKRPLESCQ